MKHLKTFSFIFHGYEYTKLTYDNGYGERYTMTPPDCICPQKISKTDYEKAEADYREYIELSNSF